MLKNNKNSLPIDQIFCKDFLQNDLPAASIDLIITDPPYYKTRGEFDFRWKSFDDYLLSVEQWAKECARLLSPSGNLFWWGHTRRIAYTQIILDRYFHFLQSGVWHKPSSPAYKNSPKRDRTFLNVTESFLHYEHMTAYTEKNFADAFNPTNEPCRQFFLQEIETLGGAKKVSAALGITVRAVTHWTGRVEWQFPAPRRIDQLISLYPPALRAEKEQAYRTLQPAFTRVRKFHRPFLNEKHRLSNVISFAQNTNITRQFNHPTQKHYVLTCQIIETLSRPGDIVLVPFAGSGTECQAAQNTGRRYIGYDIDPKYAEMARRRCLTSSIPSLFK